MEQYKRNTPMQETELEKPNVFGLKNWFHVAVFLFICLSILSHHGTDLRILEGGMDPYSKIANYMGLAGAHFARISFYLFGLAVYPFLALLFLRLVRCFLPGKKKHAHCIGYAMLAILFASAILFAMTPETFSVTTDNLGIGRFGNGKLALSGGVIGSRLAAPSITGQYEAGLIRHYLGDVGTLILSGLILFLALTLLFYHDWYSLIAMWVRNLFMEHNDKSPSIPEKGTLKDNNDNIPIHRPDSGGSFQNGIKNDDESDETWRPAETPNRSPETEEKKEKKSLISSIFSFGSDRNNQVNASQPLKDEAVPSNDMDDNPTEFMTESGNGDESNANEVNLFDDDEVVAPPLKKSAKENRQAPIRQNPIIDDDEVVASPQPTRRKMTQEWNRDEQRHDIPARQSQDTLNYPSSKRNSTQDIVIPSVFRQEPPVSQTTQKKHFPNKTAPNEEVSDYRLPTPEMLTLRIVKPQDNEDEFIQEQKNILQETMRSFNVDGRVTAITIGPRITQYEVQLAPGVKIDKITGIKDNIAMQLSAESLRMRAPIPGKNSIGIEVPNRNPSTVFLRPLLESREWKETKAAIPIALGRDITGNIVITNLAKAPHLLIAGTTGSGKSVCMNSLIMSLLFRFSPDDLRLIMVDPKFVELAVYSKLPHLITPIVNDAKKVPLALRWGVNEMERRYKIFAQVGSKELKGFNTRELPDSPMYDEDGKEIPPKMPYLIIIIDELADIMMIKDAKTEVETCIARIAQKGRAAGIHLVIATQTPRKDIVTGIIKANLPTKIACKVSQGMDSRVILDCQGAEKLLGNGDMLFCPPGGGELERIQGCFADDPEIQKVVNEISSQRQQHFDDHVLTESQEIEDDVNDIKIHAYNRDDNDFEESPYNDDYDDNNENDDDTSFSTTLNEDIINRYLKPGDGELMRKALEIIINEQKISISFLQRRLGIGYNKSAELIEQLEQRHIVSEPLPGGQKRNILITEGLELSKDLTKE